jgi:hypothetical protein
MTIAPLLEPRPRITLPGRWTFWADMLIGGQGLGNVDVSGFYCVRRLSGFGYGNATVNLPSGIPDERLLRLWSWRLWAFYDGEPYWCGCPTGVADQDGSAHVQFTLTELPGYLTRRAWDIWPERRYDQVEQTDIARDIAAPVTDVGVGIITVPGPGFRRDRTYEFLEGGSRGQLLANLAGVLEGPEFRSEYRMTAAGRPECWLRIAYPRVGDDQASLGITVPGVALGYRARWDSDLMRTDTFAVGDLPADAEEGTPRPVAIERRPQPDLPRLDCVDDWPGTVLDSTLRERAATMAARQAAPALGLTASPPEAVPAITSYAPGDTVTLRAVTPLVPAGLEVTGRLSEVEVNAAQGVATWSVIGAAPGPAERTLGGSPAPVTRETITARLDRMDAALAGVFHSGQLYDLATPPPAGPDTRTAARVTTGNWATGVPGTQTWRISDYGQMRAGPPIGAAVTVEATGIINWRAQDLTFYLSSPQTGNTARATVEGQTLPVNMDVAAKVTITAVVTAPGQIRGHLSASISPLWGYMTGGNPQGNTAGGHTHNNDGTHDHGLHTFQDHFHGTTSQGIHDHGIVYGQGDGSHGHPGGGAQQHGHNPGGGHTHNNAGGHGHSGLPFNNFTMEGDSGGTVGFNPANPVDFNIVAQFAAQAAGQGVTMTITTVTWYGGAQPPPAWPGAREEVTAHDDADGQARLGPGREL